MKILKILILLAGATGLLSGKGVAADGTNTPAGGTNAASGANIVLSNDTSNRVAQGWSEKRRTNSSGEYVLQVQDQLSYRVLEDPKPAKPEVVPATALATMQFKVSQAYPDTTITINATDKSVSQVRDELKKRLDADYYVNATVLLTLNSELPVPAKACTAYFLGEGAHNNTFSWMPDQPPTLFEALFRAGWDTQYANLKKVKLTRISDPATMATTNCMIDADEVMNKGKRDPVHNFKLQDGDTFQIPISTFMFK